VKTHPNDQNLDERRSQPIHQCLKTLDRHHQTDILEPEQNIGQWKIGWTRLADGMDEGNGGRLLKSYEILDYYIILLHSTIPFLNQF